LGKLTETLLKKSNPAINIIPWLMRINQRRLPHAQSQHRPSLASCLSFAHTSSGHTMTVLSCQLTCQNSRTSVPCPSVFYPTKPLTFENLWTCFNFSVASPSSSSNPRTASSNSASPSGSSSSWRTGSGEQVADGHGTKRQYQWHVYKLLRCCFIWRV
jgi:hypothetical protein